MFLFNFRFVFLFFKRSVCRFTRSLIWEKTGEGFSKTKMVRHHLFLWHVEIKILVRIRHLVSCLETCSTKETRSGYSSLKNRSYNFRSTRDTGKYPQKVMWLVKTFLLTVTCSSQCWNFVHSNFFLILFFSFCFPTTPSLPQFKGPDLY